LLATWAGSEHLPPFAVKASTATGAGDRFHWQLCRILGKAFQNGSGPAGESLRGTFDDRVGTQKSFYDRARY